MACANKGELGWHLAGTRVCRVLGSPLARQLTPVLQCMLLPARCWLQPWRAVQAGRQTGLQLPFSFFSKVTTLKSPPSVPSASTHRYGRVWAGRAALLGCLESGAESAPSLQPKAGSRCSSRLGSRAEPSARPHAIETSNSSAAPHGPAAFSVTNYETSGVNQPKQSQAQAGSRRGHGASAGRANPSSTLSGRARHVHPNPHPTAPFLPFFLIGWTQDGMVGK